MSKAINIDEVISKATIEAIREYDKERIMRTKKGALHNTKLLMQNYNSFKNHIENISEDIEELEFEYYNSLEPDEVWIASIRRSKVKTIKMIAYIDSALEVVKEKSRKECAEYKYRAFELYYIEKKTNEQIVEILGCGKNQPKIWSDLVLDELSTLLWGVEALGI